MSAILTLLRESAVPLLQNFSCGGSFGWRCVAYLDMSDPSQQCPSAWREITTPHRVCGRSSGSSCEGLTYSTGSEQYDQVCGRIIGYQIGSTNSFEVSSHIDTPYFEGVGVTHGSPRQHIWSFAAGFDEGTYSRFSTCPCVTGITNGNRIPSFVGQNYFCESGITMWNGTGGFHLNDDPL